MFSILKCKIQYSNIPYDISLTEVKILFLVECTLFKTETTLRTAQEKPTAWEGNEQDQNTSSTWSGFIPTRCHGRKGWQHSSQPSPTATNGRRSTTLRGTVTGRQWKGDQLQLRTLQAFKLHGLHQGQCKISFIMKFLSSCLATVYSQSWQLLSVYVLEDLVISYTFKCLIMSLTVANHKMV